MDTSVVLGARVVVVEGAGNSEKKIYLKIIVIVITKEGFNKVTKWFLVPKMEYLHFRPKQIFWRFAGYESNILLLPTLYFFVMI